MKNRGQALPVTVFYQSGAGFARPELFIIFIIHLLIFYFN